ncbi:MAG: hypothetical protein Q9159_007231 [Coniocarpon cinnabarinum]
MYTTSSTLALAALATIPLTMAAPAPQSSSAADPSTYQSPGIMKLWNTASGPYQNHALVAAPLGTNPTTRELHLVPNVDPTPAYMNGTESQLNSPDEYAYLNFVGDQPLQEFCVSRPDVGEISGAVRGFSAVLSTTSFSRAEAPHFRLSDDGEVNAEPEAANNAFVACEKDGVVRLEWANPSETQIGGYPNGCVLARLSTATATPEKL